MRKLFFSAIFLIAFSSISMANTIADEEVVRSNSECNKITALAGPKVDPCLGAFVSTYNANVNEYGTAGALAIAQGAYRACQKFLGIE